MRSLLSAAPTAATRRTREATHILMKVETHNHPTAIAPFPGAATGSGGEIRDEGATRRRREAEGAASSASRCRICGCRRLPQPWETGCGKPERIASALDIMLQGPIGAAAFNNEFGRPNLARLLPHVRAGSRRRGARLSQADHDRRRRRATSAPSTRAKRAAPDGALLDPARRPGHADRHGRRRRVVDDDGRQHRRPRFRFGAARQRRDPAPRAGSDRPLLAAGRGKSDPVDPRRRRRRPVERVARARSRRRRGRDVRLARTSRPRSPE